MNQRAVLIGLVAVFVTCFVGTCAVGTLTVVKGLSGELAEVTRPQPPPAPSQDEPELEPSPEPAPLPGDELEGTTEETEEDFVPEYEPPVLGTGQFAVFHLAPPKVQPWAALQKAARSGKVKVFKGGVPEGIEPPYLELTELTTKDYAVVGGVTLEEGKGLTPGDRAALPKAKTVSVIDVTLPVGGTHLLDAAKVIGAFAAATGGVLWDEESQQYLSQEAWQVRRVKSWERGVPHISMNYVVYVDNADQGVNLRSGGLEHFGLPELELKGSSRRSADQAVALMNAIAQTLIERTEPVMPGPLKVELEALRHPKQREYLLSRCMDGAQKRLEVQLQAGADPGRPLLLVRLPGGGSASERVEAAIATLFGASDHVDTIEHDSILTELSREQMAVFKKTIKPRFQKGLKSNEVLLVKAPFKTASGGREWMWVEVSKILPNGNIEGLLANEPDDVPELRSGSPVVVYEDELFDWLLEQADGTRLGNETGKVIQERMGR